MIANLHPYREYKDSGLPWLPQVPKHWDVRRSKYLFREVDRRSKTGTETRLSMSQKHGLIPSSQIDEKRLVSASNVGGKLCEPGDLVLNRLKAHLGVIALSPSHGLVSPDYTVLRPIGTVNYRFFCAVYRSPYCGQELRKRAKGIVEGFWRLYTDDFYDIRVSVPPPDEQAAIVRFLDYANGRLERAIRAKRKVIALLHEQKQAIIHRAVTSGLDPTVHLKPSGIPWLGDIPEHWEVQRLKRVCRVQGGYAFPSSAFGESGIPVVRMNNLRRGVLNLIGVAKIPEAECVQAFSLNAGDILYGLSGSIGATGSLGNYAVVTEHDLPAMLNQRVARFVPKRERIQPNFLIQLVQSSIFYEQVLADTTGTAQFNVSTNDIENVAVGLPPLGEQERIVSRIGESVAPLATAISRLEREIELLREYRTRLVADVVTGKLDVRQAAKVLPTEFVAEEPTPESEELTDSEEVEL